MGSVKDLKVIKSPEKDSMGKGLFTFSDRYSIFDWGEMPQHIEGKGASLCLAGAYFFERMREKNIPSHYRGVVKEGATATLSQLNGPSNVMEVDLVRVIKPGFSENRYDYSSYRGETSNFLIPVEVIYRNALPEGSSLLSRLKEGKLKPSDIGFERIPEPGTVLDKPLVDVSTKLESRDRYMDWKEAKEISGLPDGMIDNIKSLILEADSLISEEVSRLDLLNVDGKLEFALDDTGKLIVVDVTGTPDECRFIYGSMDGVAVSKEIMRKYYRKTSWYKEVKKASSGGERDWKKAVESTPPEVPQELLETVSWAYKSFCNALTKRKWFEVPDFKEVVKRLDYLRGKYRG